MKKTNFDKMINALESISDVHIFTSDKKELLEIGMSIDDNRFITYDRKYDCIKFYNLGDEELIITRNSILVDMLYTLFENVFDSLKEDM